MKSELIRPLAIPDSSGRPGSAAVEIRVRALMTGLVNRVQGASVETFVSGGIRRIISARTDLERAWLLAGFASYSAASVEVRAKHKRRQVWL